MLKQYESAYNERNNQKNDAYVREYVNHFTNGGYIPGIEMEYTLLNQIAQNIPVEQVNQYIQDMIGEDNIVIGLTDLADPGPDHGDKDRPALRSDSIYLKQWYQGGIKAYRIQEGRDHHDRYQPGRKYLIWHEGY